MTPSDQLFLVEAFWIGPPQLPEVAASMCWSVPRTAHPSIHGTAALFDDKSRLIGSIEGASTSTYMHGIGLLYSTARLMSRVVV